MIRASASRANTRPPWAAPAPPIGGFTASARWRSSSRCSWCCRSFPARRAPTCSPAPPLPSRWWKRRCNKKRGPEGPRSYCGFPTGLAANGRELDFHAAVLRATRFGGVGGDGARRPLTLDIEATLIDALIGQDGGDGHRTALAERQIVLVRAGGIGVAIDIDDGLVELLEHQGDRHQGLVELRLHRGLVGGESDVGGHVEDDLVAHAGHRNTGALELGAQLGFLLVHVIADGS